MFNNEKPINEWSDRLEAGERDDALLALAARLERAGREEPSAPAIEFRRQLRRDLLNQYETTAGRPANRLWRWAGSLAALGLLAAVVLVMWLSMSGTGRVVPGGAPNTQILPISTAPTLAAVLGSYSENVPEGLVPGGTIEVKTGWHIPDSFGEARPFAEIRDDTGRAIAQAEGQLHAIGEDHWATLIVALPDTLPPGGYSLVLGLHDPAGARMPIYDRISSSVIFEYLAEFVTIGTAAPAPGAGPVATALPPDGSRYTLLGYAVNGGIVTESMQTDGGEVQTTPSLLAPGLDIEVIAHWSRPVDGGGAMAFVHLLDSDGTIIAQSDAPIQAAGTPDVRRAKASLPLNVPADLAPGAYQLVGGLLDPTSGAQLPFNVTTGQVSQYLIIEYSVSAGDASLEQMNEAVIELQGSQTALELNLEDAEQDVLVVREVSPASGTVISGTEPFEFTITLDYALVSLPEANIEVRVTELTGGNGRGVGLAVSPIVQGTGTTTVVITVSPDELSQPTELGLWLQIKPSDARSAPILFNMPGERWRYEP